MPWKRDKHPYTWKDLEGHIASKVLSAPRTGGDPAGGWPQVHTRILGYLLRNALRKPWADQLTLIAAVMTAQRRDVGTVESMMKVLQPRFALLFQAFGLETVCQWSIGQHLIPYVRGEVLPQDSLHTRVMFFKRYMSAAKLVADWFDLLPEDQQEGYRPFLLPTVNPFLAKEFSKAEREVERQQQDHRKEETEAVVPEFTALRVFTNK